MLAAVPENVIVESDVPSPVVNVSPVVPASVSAPLVTATVIVSVASSTSATVIALPLAVENTRGVSSFVACAPGTAFTGASSAPWIVTVTSCAVPSAAVTVKVSVSVFALVLSACTATFVLSSV